MFKVFTKALNPEEMFRIQKQQYRECLLLQGVCVAGRETPLICHVSSLGHFYSLFITGSFTTLQLDDGATDYAVNYLRGQLVDGSNNTKLFNDYVPLNLWLTPGRVLSPLAVNIATAKSPDSLFFPIELEYLWTVNGDIICNIKNDSDVDLTAKILFHGIRVVTQRIKSGV